MFDARDAHGLRDGDAPMPDPARATLRRVLAIRLAVIRQRSPSLLRRLTAKNRADQERSTTALLDAFMSELDGFDLSERPRRVDPPPRTF